MLPGQSRQFLGPANCGPDTLVFIGCYGHPVGASAYQYAKVEITAFYSTGYRVSKIRIINRIGRIGAKIFQISVSKPVGQGFFIVKTGMVRAYGNLLESAYDQEFINSASFFNRRFSTTAATTILSSYSNNSGIATTIIVNASGVGVIKAARIRMITMA